MPNPCPTCHAQLDPGTPHTFCARTKEPKARELATRIAAMEANFDLLHRLTVDKREKDSLASKMDNLFGGGIDLATRLEALERAKENTEHGGGLDRNATPREGRCPTPAASALPTRPEDIDLSWSLEFNLADDWRGRQAEEERLYALSLESRLAESNKHRNEYAESNLRTASKLADMSEAFARERTDHAALKAKLAECEGPNGLEAIRSTLSKCWSALGITGVVPDPIWALVKKQREEADWLRPQVRTLTADRDALRAKLDGVREALSDAIGTVGGARRSCVGDHYIHSPQVRLDQVDRWRSALAAAEDTNTGDAGRTPAGQCSTDRSTDGQPPTSTEPAVDEPGPVTNPAVSHPSTAPAFEMTFEQRTQLYSFLGMSTLGSRRERESLAAFVTDLVRSELRKAREGWVTREVAERALEQCALEYISGSSVHANAKDYLTAAIRAASKEASDGTR